MDLSWRTVLGLLVIVASSIGMFVGFYTLQGMNFETYFMSYVIIGVLSFVGPLFGWGVGVYTIASDR